MNAFVNLFLQFPTSTRMISTHSRSFRSRNSRQGFSLIEVAIALVIFVIGALAIIRIFPGALSVIGNNGNQQIATNLNRGTLVSLQSEQTNAITKKSFNAVPYANFNIRVNADANSTLAWTADNVNHTADFADIDASVIGVPRFNTTLPTSEDISMGVNNSALSRFRGIQGEETKVLTFNGSTDQYVLTQFPISLAKINGGTKDVPLAPTISQEYIVQNARIDKQGNITFKDATIEDATGKIVRLDDTTNTEAQQKNTITANSMIYVSYRYFNSGTPDNKIWGISDEPITTPAVPNLVNATFTVSPPTTTRGARVIFDTNNPTTTGAVAEAIDVRIKRLVGAGVFGSPADPAPTATDYPNVNQKGAARLGLVRLNSAVTTGTVTVDYIADWSFLLQDGVPSIPTNATYPAVPATPPDLTYRQLALGAPFIQDQAPASVYSLLIESGIPYRSYYGTDQIEPPANDRLVRATDPQKREDELRSGKVTFIVENSAVRARVAYQTRDQWVQQLSIAAKAYKPFVANSAEPWRNYFLGDDNYLYFHAGEAGKTISISYSYNDVTDDGAVTPLPDKVIVDRPYVIDNQLIDATGAVVTSGFVNAGSQIARVKLQTAKGEDFPASKRGVPINLAAIQAVKGTSITSRTAYINGTKYAQNLLTTNRGANS